MSQNFEPPTRRVTINMSFVNGDGREWDGAFASEKLQEYEKLVKAGMEGWRLIEALFGDDWGPPPRGVQFLVNGKAVASIYYDKPKPSRR
jgi:hypothetical protein